MTGSRGDSAGITAAGVAAVLACLWWFPYTALPSAEELTAQLQRGGRR